ncbi:MAG: YgeY family selenium metabolism-linked hydrolase [Lachnospiraceae bacterium]|nr:YgeY family selenium metabolism-linked hydrolase [Lachnospiraceae bacterium]
MREHLKTWTEEYEDALLAFYREAVRTRSYSDEEGAYAEKILQKMRELDYDEAYIDRVGNVVGRVGNGPRIVHFDSHMDTVQVNDEEGWKVPPFEAELVDGMVYGRGSVDMKGGLSASVFAAALAKKEGLLDGKTIYVTGSVCEEYCDGVCLEHFYQDSGVRPDFCVICEPSDNVITLGHTGKVQARIKTHGVSAHGSAPEKGLNAVYEMAEIIQRVEALNKKLHDREGGGTIVLSDISCVSASLNAVPSECEIYLDRRLRLGETVEQVKGELDGLISGKRASWEPGTLRHTSWRGTSLLYTPAHEPWKIAKEHPLTQACCDAYEAVFGQKPDRFDFWDFGTNAVVPVSMGVATIGFGPGEYKLAHMQNECCDPEKVTEACRFYAELIARL